MVYIRNPTTIKTDRYLAKRPKNTKVKTVKGLKMQEVSKKSTVRIYRHNPIDSIYYSIQKTIKFLKKLQVLSVSRMAF